MTPNNFMRPPVHVQSQTASKLLGQYGCEPIHFAGTDNGLYERYVPAGLPTAQSGGWMGGPEIDLFETIKRKLGDLPFITEDLRVQDLLKLAAVRARMCQARPKGTGGGDIWRKC